MGNNRNEKDKVFSPLGYTRVKIVGRNAITKCLIDSGNLFSCLMSKDLADQLGVKVKPVNKSVGTANKNAIGKIIGRTVPIKICIESIPGNILIRPYVMENLAHPLNLSQAFLRKFNVDMIFREKHVLLKMKNGVASLTARALPIDTKSVDTRIEAVLEKYRAQGRNPARTKNETLCLGPLRCKNTAYRVYSRENCVLKPQGQQRIEIQHKGNLEFTEECNAVLLEPTHNMKLNESGLYIHPGIYNRYGNNISICVSNMSENELTLAKNQFVGYVRENTSNTPYTEITEKEVRHMGENNSYKLTPFQRRNTTRIKDTSNAETTGNEIGHVSEDDGEKLVPPQERDISLMNETDKNRWREFLINKLELDDNSVLNQNKTCKNKIIDILMENLPAIAASDHDYGNTDLLQFHIQIKPNTRPIAQRARPLDPIKTADLKRQLQSWIKGDIIEPSLSEWNSPLVPVAKKNTDVLRWCVDYRRLNEVTIKDTFPLPNINDNLNKLAGAKYYTSLDALGAYHSIKIHPESREYTAFCCPEGSYMYKKMPFGMSNSACAYSRLIHMALSTLGAQDFALAYLDDILVYSKTIEEHVIHLQKILELHTKFGLKLNLKKCHIFRTEIDYLGHKVSPAGIHMCDKHVEKILDWEKPKTGKALKSYLGFTGYYRQFIKGYGNLTANLCNIKNTKEKIDWTPEMTENFEKLKQCFKDKPVRGYPDFYSSHPFILDVDWSSNAVGAVLSQLQGDPPREVFLACAAKKNNEAESNYPSWKGEMLGVIVGIKKFEHLLMSKQFILRTDANAIKYLSTMKNNRGIFGRWQMYLAEFDFSVVHRPGIQHLTADALSRRTDITDTSTEELSAIENRVFRKFTVIEKAEVARLSQTDPVLNQVIALVREKRKPDSKERDSMRTDVKKYMQLFECLTETKGILYLQPPTVNGRKTKARVCLPQKLQKTAFLSAHSGHMGMSKTFDLLKENVYFPDMHSFVVMHVRNCVECIAKGTSYGKETHKPYRPFYAAFNSLLFVDTVGPITPAGLFEGNKCLHILTIQDACTRFLVATPIPDLTTKTISQALITHWIHRFSVPSRIHSDNGSSFCSNLMKDTFKHFDIEKTTTPVYSPQSNRVERAHRVIGDLIRSNQKYPTEKWVEKLQIAVYTYNTTVNRLTGFAPLHALTGQKPSMPLTMIFPSGKKSQMSTNTFIENLKTRYNDMYDKMLSHHKTTVELDNSVHKRNQKDDIQVGDTVYYFLARVKRGISKKLQTRWTGPFVVRRKISDSLYVIFPMGKWAKNPREIATIVSRLRKCDKNIYYSELNPTQRNQIDLPAILADFNDLSEDHFHLTEDIEENAPLIEMSMTPAIMRDAHVPILPLVEQHPGADDADAGPDGEEEATGDSNDRPNSMLSQDSLVESESTDSPRVVEIPNVGVKMEKEKNRSDSEDDLDVDVSTRPSVRSTHTSETDFGRRSLDSSVSREVSGRSLTSQTSQQSAASKQRQMLYRNKRFQGSYKVTKTNRPRRGILSPKKGRTRNRDTSSNSE